MAGIRLTKLDLFLAICILASDLVEGAVPRNVEYDCLNLNCTVTWDPPANNSDNDIVFYTILYQEYSKLDNGNWIQKTECTNTSLTFCHLGADIDNLIGTWYVRVKAIREGLHYNDSFTEVSFNPYYGATLGAAEITNISTTHRSIYLRWLSPHIPYYHSNGIQKRMTDYFTIEYYITYCIPSEPSSCVDVETGYSEFVTLLEGIFPWTTYEITLEGNIKYRDYGDPIRVTVTTDEEAPVKGVTLSEDWQFHDCDYSPNKRNVSISWEVPESQYWHGKLLRYETKVWYQDTESNVTVIERNTSDTSMVLEDMSRWKSLNIDVYTCNSAGCTGSAKPIRLDAVKVGRDAPLNVSAFETSSSSFNVTWARPDNDECIKSYNVRYTSDLHQGETEVTDQHAHITNVPSGAEYTVSLSANIYKGYDSTDESEPRSTTVRLLAPVKGVTLSKDWQFHDCDYSPHKKNISISWEDGVLNDRPVAPSYDESFQYDTLNGTLISTSTYHINASISVASVTDSSPSTDTNGKTHNFDRSSANIIKGVSQNVPLPSLEDILISPPTPDDNSSTTDIELIEGNFLDRTSENLRSPNDSSNGVNTYATLRFVSAGGGDVGADTQQASSSSDETRSMSQQMCGEAEESERLQHMPAGSDNSGVQYEDGNITSLQDIILMEDRVGMIDTFENKFSVIPHLKESIGVNSCKFDTNQSPKVKDEGNESLNSEVEINPIQCIGPLMGLDVENLLGVQDFSSGSWENDNPTFEPDQPNDVGNGKSNTASNNGTDISDYVQSQLHKKLAMDSNQNDSYFPTRAINNNNPPSDNIIDLHSILDIPKEGNTSEEKQMEAQRIETSTNLTVPTLKESLDIDPQDSDNMVNMGAPTCCQPNQTSNLDYVAQRETINLSSTESNYGDHAQQGIEMS
ncbi:uncharacterized protein [Ptychodera flava]|uniref:uncharacterized protein n=1 Tax=Ptychodera flava TaxID=63121 RepID=UPI00396A15B0